MIRSKDKRTVPGEEIFDFQWNHTIINYILLSERKIPYNAQYMQHL